MRFDQNHRYTNWKEMLAFVIENAPLHDIISHTRSDKGNILHYNLVIVYTLIIV